MIRVTPLELEFEAERDLRFSEYAGSSWRSALGATLRRSVCLTGKPVCDGCPVRAHCAYGQWFEPLAPDAERAAGLQLADSPRGYVLAPLQQGGRVSAGQPLRIELTAIGRARSALPAVLAAIPRLSLHGVPLRLNAIRYRPPASPGLVTSAALRADHSVSLVPPACPPAVRITFTHPLRLQCKGREIGVADWTPVLFMTSLLRRVVALAAAFDQPVNIEHKQLIAGADALLRVRQTALHWQSARRVSRRHAKPLPLSGLLGTVVVDGDLTPFWPLLWAGQWLHVGKAVVMGLGRYQLEPLHAAPGGVTAGLLPGAAGASSLHHGASGGLFMPS